MDWLLSKCRTFISILRIHVRMTPSWSQEIWGVSSVPCRDVISLSYKVLFSKITDVQFYPQFHFHHISMESQSFEAIVAIEFIKKDTLSSNVSTKLFRSMLTLITKWQKWYSIKLITHKNAKLWLYRCSMCIREQIILMQWGRHKMAAILQTTIPNALSWILNEKLRIKFHYCPIDIEPSFVQIMASRPFGVEPLFEAMIARLIDMCSRPRCVYQNAEVDNSTNNYIPQHSLAAYVLCIALLVDIIVRGFNQMHVTIFFWKASLFGVVCVSCNFKAEYVGSTLLVRCKWINKTYPTNISKSHWNMIIFWNLVWFKC